MLDIGNSISYLLSFSEGFSRSWQYIIDIFDYKLIKCFVDSIPASVLLIDAVIYGEIKYLQPIINYANKDINREKIRELCFNKSNANTEKCPIYRNIENNTRKELIRSPLLMEDDILNSYLLAKAITRNKNDLSKSIRTLIGWDLLNYFTTSVSMIETRNRLGFCDKHALRYTLTKNLNKIIDSKDLILNVKNFNKTNTSNETKSLIELFKNTQHPKDFKPQQLNRQILNENYEGLSVNNKINPIWRLIKDYGICGFHQTQFWEAVAVQFLTLYLASLIEFKNYPVFSFLTFTALFIIIWNDLFGKGAIHDWFTHKSLRFSAIFVLWLGSLLISYLYIN